MAATLPDISIGQSWIDINTASGIAVGTAMEIFNKGNGTLILHESTTEPSSSAEDGILLSPMNEPYAVASVSSGSLKIWAKAQETLGSKVNVQEVT